MQTSPFFLVTMDADFSRARKKTDEYGITVYRDRKTKEILGYTWTDEHGNFHLYRCTPLPESAKTNPVTLSRLRLAPVSKL